MINLVILSGSAFLSEITQLMAFGKEINILFATHDPGSLLSYVSKADAVLIDNRESIAGSTLFEKISIPIIVVAPSAPVGFKMIHQGATEMILASVILNKPNPFTYQLLSGRIKNMLCLHHAVKNRTAKNVGKPLRGRIIAIGASTGGTETILEIIKKFPAETPPILIVQHMPPVFTRLYAERADKLCKVEVWEAQDGDKLANGLILIAPGDFHMKLVKEGGGYAVRLDKGAQVHNQRPAVDVLFDSVADTAGANAIGLILTGMGEDGARGLNNMRKKGAYTIGQDEKTSTVYGMPKAAINMGAVCIQLPLGDIAKEVMALMYE